MKPILLVSLLISTSTLIAQTDSSSIPKADSGIYKHPEIQPEYPGGEKAWNQFLQKNLSYPEKAQDKGVSGTVLVQFWVDSTGISHDVTAVSGPMELREESIRVVKKVKIWVPGVEQGKKVNAWKIEPMRFVMMRD